jgi:hypothetical protein
MSDRLTDIMDFDHVIEVHEDGSITHRPDIFAPALHDGELEGDEWELLDGFSGQDRYSGPIMHQSEVIGGGMERFIRENPGIYVSLVDYPIDDEDSEPDGWAVAVKKVA